MKTWIGPAVLFLVALGCGGVLSTHPVGGEPVAVAEADWEGTWIGKDGALELRVVDGPGGVLEAAWIEDEGDGFTLERVTLELRGLEDWTVGNLDPEGDSDREHYLWLRLELDGSELLAWLPREEAFGELVESGLLPGRVEDGEVVLSRLEPSHLAVIRDESRGALFHWDEPLVLRRLAD